jgi:hypothetical protein
MEITRDDHLKDLSSQWCELHPPMDGDDRTPYDMLKSGVITEDEFFGMMSTGLQG